MMALEPHGPDTYVGVGPRYPWGGLYGGQIVAQALWAAFETVDPEYRVHSLHAYFIRRGDHDEPIRFEVDRLRNGRSFVTRSVVARQAVGAILGMSASFQRDEAGPDVELAEAPLVPAPDELDPNRWSPMFENRKVPRPGEPGRTTHWLSMTDPIGDNPRLHACALAYLSDDVPVETVASQHPDHGAPDSEEQNWMAASLDHAIWFHRPLEADQWHLFDTRCQGLMSSRGLALGQVFTADGSHVATIAQEVLVRHRKPT